MFFDGLVATHRTGPLLEENHHYPYGLTMKGISNGAPGKLANKKKYNGYEENNDFDLNLYESFYRTHDPQIGRFLQLDPKPSDFESLYAAMGNNPIVKADPLGDTTYLYNDKGNYKGVLYDGLNTNEVVFLKDNTVSRMLSMQEGKKFSDNVLGKLARDPAFAVGRITAKSIKALTRYWKDNKENEMAGFIYVNRRTKEIEVFACKDCGTSSNSADPYKLAKHYDNVSKKGSIIGMWHTHPEANSYHGSQPTSTKANDYTDGAITISAFKNGTIGLIVNKNSATIYPISNPVTPSAAGRKDKLVTTPRYGPNYSTFRDEHQYGVFNQNISPQTKWEQ